MMRTIDKSGRFNHVAASMEAAQTKNPHDHADFWAHQIGCKWVSIWNLDMHISRSENMQSIHGPPIPKIPDREISIAHSLVVADNFPIGKLSMP